MKPEMQTNAVSKEQLLSWLGPPDLFCGDGRDYDFVYFFDHHEAGSNRDEWYLHVRNGRLSSSGYNRSGINDLSKLKPRSSSRLDVTSAKNFLGNTLFRQCPLPILSPAEPPPIPLE